MNVKWTTPALQDLAEITEYMAQDSVSAAARFIRTIEENAHHLRLFPYSGKKIERFAVRQWVAPSTPYKIIYQIENEEVLILSLLHGARR